MPEETTVGTFGITFPDTPKFASGEDIPALIILNPVKQVEPTSNASWSQTLPTRHKLRKEPYSESDLLGQPDSGLIKPAKSTGAIYINTVTQPAEVANKSNDSTSLHPEVQINTEHFLKGVLDVDGQANDRESTGYVFMEPPKPPSSSSVNNQTESDTTNTGSELEKDTIYLKPSSIPIPSNGFQLPQHMLPGEPTAVIESVYDTPKSSGITAAPQEGKQTTDLGLFLSSPGSKETIMAAEVPSHYDVPKSVLMAFRQEAAEQGFSAQPNLGAHSAPPHLSSPQESHYDIPKHLLKAKDGATTGQMLGNVDKQIDCDSLSDLEKETNMDDVEPLESEMTSDDHEYCMPPDVTLNMIRAQQQKIQAGASQTDTAHTAISKPIPKKRKQNDNVLHSNIVLAPRPAKKPTILAKGGSGSATGSSEELHEPAPKHGAAVQNSGVSKDGSDSEHEYDFPPLEGLAISTDERAKPSIKPKPKPKAVPRSQSRQAVVPQNVMQELLKKKTFQQVHTDIQDETNSSVSSLTATPGPPPVAKKPTVKHPTNI